MTDDELRDQVERGHRSDLELSDGIAVGIIRDTLNSVRGMLLGMPPVAGEYTFRILAAKREALEDVLREMESAAFSGHEAQAKLSGDYVEQQSPIC